MNKFENYKPNVDVIDSNHIKDEVIGIHKVCAVPYLNIIKSSRSFDSEVNYNKPLAAAVLGINNVTVDCFGDRKRETTNTWSDIDAQQFYLKSPPNNYLILGKPGTGAFALGEAISEKIQCVHLCPRHIILDEILQKSQTGKSLEFNMRHDKEIRYNILLPLLKNKLESPVVKHRGYVISGFPLISSEGQDLWFFKSMHSEEAVLAAEECIIDLLDLICKKKKRKPKSEKSYRTRDDVAVIDDYDNYEEEEEDEDIFEDEANISPFLLEPSEDIISKNENYFNSKKLVMLNQLNELLNLDTKPDFYIYITCPDADVVTKRLHKYLIYPNASSISETIPIIRDQELRWPGKYTMKFPSKPFGASVFRKYKVRHPIDFPENAADQICNYRDNILPFWEKKYKDIDPRFIVKVDGRIQCLEEILKHISEITLCVPQLQYSLIPEPLNLPYIPKTLHQFWLEVEYLVELESEDTPPFNYYPSVLYNICPVELKKRHIVIGKPEFALKLFRHVYLMSSYDAYIGFYKNPRPYLDIKYLEPVCRVIITGTKSSGKTMIAECLSWIFGCEIIHFDRIFKEESEKKEKNISELIFSEIAMEIHENRIKSWNDAEAQRVKDLEVWHAAALVNLKKYITFLSEYENIKRTIINEVDKQTFEHNFAKAKRRLCFLPFLDDLEQCKASLDRRNVMEYAPAKLTVIRDRPEFPVCEDPDVKEAISKYIFENDLEADIDLTPEEVMEVVINKLKSKDDASLETYSTYSKFIIDGFPPQIEYWSLLANAELLPDYTITVMENRIIDKELLQNYITIERALKNHEERFVQSRDPLVMIKMEISRFVPKYIGFEQTVSDIIWEIIDSLVILDEEQEINEATNITSLQESFIKFRDNWDFAKLILEDEKKQYVEISVGFNSDVKVLDEALLHIRKGYCFPSQRFVDEEGETKQNMEIDWSTYNDRIWLGELGIYCPIAYYDYGVLWEGKPEFCLKYRNKYNYFSKEECLKRFQKDETKYEAYCKPHKKIPSWKICVMGCSGSGRTQLSKFLAKELGVLHVDFEEALNNYLMPKHFKRVGRRYENVFRDQPLDESSIEEFSMDDESEKVPMSDNEVEIRLMIYNYLEGGLSIPSTLMQRVLNKIWREDPFESNGFVLDGFPRIPTDVDDMVDSFCIPDLVIELKCDDTTALERLLPEMIKQWKSQLNEVQKEVTSKLQKEKEIWNNLVTKEYIVKANLEQIMWEVMSIIDQRHTSIQPINRSQINLYDDSPEEVDLNEVLLDAYDEIIERNPEPANLSRWETYDKAIHRIYKRMEYLYKSESEGIKNLKSMLSYHKIIRTRLNASKTFEKVSRTALFNISWLRNRKHSIFEQTVVVPVDTAEQLLRTGYYFLSKFGRISPVYVCENPKTTYNPFHISLRDGTLYPVLHRNCVYFVHKKEAVEKIRTDPLRYAISDLNVGYIEHPMRMSVIGPPKSGKSSLTARLAKEYGLMCVSGGQVIRRIILDFHWCKLAQNMHMTLREGKTVEYEDVIKATQGNLIDYRFIQYGFILEGYPEYPPVAIELGKRGIYPIAVFDLSCPEDKLISNHHNEEHLDILKYLPPYSDRFVRYRITKWQETAYEIRDFIYRDVQNLYTINGNQVRWKIFRDVKKHLENIMAEIHYFISNVNKDIVIPARVMAIDNRTFMNKCSGFKNFCPICLSKKYIKHSNEPVDKRGVVQYQGLFYWVCSDHMTQLRKNPKKYLFHSANVTIPPIPSRINRYDPSMVYENGVCLVTYAEKLPNQIIMKGLNKYVATYEHRVYLFCGEKCLRKFLERPHMYYDITVFKESEKFPKILLETAPDIGYLEQTVAELLTQACCAVNVLRPKYPGLDVKVSALLFIGLYLKIKNSRFNEKTLKIYKKVYDVYEARSKYILNLTSRMREMDNPFLSYPTCCKIVLDKDAVVRKLDKECQIVMRAKSKDKAHQDQSDTLIRIPNKQPSLLMKKSSVVLQTLASSLISLAEQRNDEEDTI